MSQLEVTESVNFANRYGRLIQVDVHDPNTPGIVASFDYQVFRDDQIFLSKVGFRNESILTAPTGLSPTVVRDLPLARWERAARTRVTYRCFPPQISPEEAVELLYPGLRDSSQPADVRKYRSLLHLGHIAGEYREAQKTGFWPGDVIAQRHHVNASTVRSWVSRARKAGLLERARP